MDDDLVIHSVSFAEFDIDIGNCLKASYPPFSLPKYDTEYLGNLCLPDGAHLTTEDSVFLALPLQGPVEQYHPSEPAERRSPLARTPSNPDLPSNTDGSQRSPSSSRTAVPSATSLDGTADSNPAPTRESKAISSSPSSSASSSSPQTAVGVTVASVQTKPSPNKRHSMRRPAPKRKSMRRARPVSMFIPSSPITSEGQDRGTHNSFVRGVSFGRAKPAASPSGERRRGFLGGQRTQNASSAGGSTTTVTRGSAIADGTASLQPRAAQGQSSSTPSGTSVDSAAPNTLSSDEKQGTVMLYGIAVFKNVPAENVRRGAIQRSVLLLMWKPYFSAFEAVLGHVLTQLIPENLLKLDDTAALKAMYRCFRAFVRSYEGDPMPLKMFGREFEASLSLHGLVPMQGDSLTFLVRTFQSDVMSLWYALLAGKRIIFLGNPAKSVGLCCLSAQVMTSPLALYQGCTHPYAGLTHLDVFMEKKYMAGTTNSLFGTKTQWYDVLANVNTGEIQIPQPFGLKPTSGDRMFAKTLLTGIASGDFGEEKLRQQFTLHTMRFINAVLQPQKAKEYNVRIVEGIRDQPEFQAFINKLKTSADSFLRCDDICLDGRQVLAEIVGIATAPPLTLPETWPDTEMEVIKISRRKEASLSTIVMGRDWFELRNRRGETRQQLSYLKVAVYDRDPPDTPANCFQLRLDGNVVAFKSVRHNRICDEVESRARYVRGIISSARKTGHAEERDKFGRTALHRACAANRVEEVKEIIRLKTPDVNAVDANGSTPLLICAASGSYDVIDELLEVSDLEVNIPNKSHASVFHEMLTHWPNDASQKLQGRLISLFDKLKRKGGHVRFHGSSGDTPLHQAVALGNILAIKWFVSNGANLNAVNDYGETPLHYAVRSRLEEVIKLMLDRGADKHLPNSDGVTPLGAAREIGNDMFAILCGLPIDQIGTNISSDTDEYGQSRLHIAAHEGRMDQVFQLINAGASVNVEDRNGWTPLHNAASQGHLDVFQLLLRAPNVDVNAKTKDFTSILHYVVRLHGASDDQMTRSLDMMAKQGVDIDARDKCNQTPLHQAVFRGGFSAALWLLKNGADVNAESNTYTPLHMAVQRGDPTFVTLLLEFDADVNAMSRDGSPKDMASKFAPALLEIIGGTSARAIGSDATDDDSSESTVGSPDQHAKLNASAGMLLDHGQKKKQKPSFFSALTGHAQQQQRDDDGDKLSRALDDAHAEFWQRRFSEESDGIRVEIDGVGNVTIEVSDAALSRLSSAELSKTLSQHATIAIKNRHSELQNTRRAAADGLVTSEQLALFEALNG